MKFYYQQIEPFDRKAFFFCLVHMLARIHSQSSPVLGQMGLGRWRSLCLKSLKVLLNDLKMRNSRTPIPDARLYVELARCHSYHSIYLFVLNVLQPCYQCCAVFLVFFFSFLGCICTNVIYSSNAPKLFCCLSATKYPLTCLCTRKTAQSVCA